jgi:hypothetical protein
MRDVIGILHQIHPANSFFTKNIEKKPHWCVVELEIYLLLPKFVSNKKIASRTDDIVDVDGSHVGSDEWVQQSGSEFDLGLVFK